MIKAAITASVAMVIAACTTVPSEIDYAGDPHALEPYAEATALQWDCGDDHCDVTGEIWVHNPTYLTWVVDVSCTLYNGPYIMGDGSAVRSNLILSPRSSRELVQASRWGEPERVAFALECEITRMEYAEQ
jgi:hypothetical protein